MTAIPARRRRRMIAAMVTSGLSVIALPSGLFLGTNSLLRASGGNSIDSRGTVDIPSSVVEMLAVINSRNEVASLALLAVTPEGKGGTIVSIPVGASADVAKTELPRRIADSYATGGLLALETDVENLFIDINKHILNIEKNKVYKTKHNSLHDFNVLPKNSYSSKPFNGSTFFIDFEVPKMSMTIS